MSTSWKDGYGRIKTSVPDCCAWYGIVCHGDGDIKELHLANNGLKGTIPSELLRITSLEVGNF
jgi:hypothetical protein